MATTFSVINREVAQSLNAFAGAQVTTREAAYTTAPITSGGVGDSPIFNPSFIFDRALDVQGQIAQEICNQRTHPGGRILRQTSLELPTIQRCQLWPLTARRLLAFWGSDQRRHSADGVSWEEMRLYCTRPTHLRLGPGVHDSKQPHLLLKLNCGHYVLRRTRGLPITSTIALPLTCWLTRWSSARSRKFWLKGCILSKRLISAISTKQRLKPFAWRGCNARCATNAKGIT